MKSWIEGGRIPLEDLQWGKYVVPRALPGGWMAPQKEFLMYGLDGKHYIFSFMATTERVCTPDPGGKTATEKDVPGCACRLCGTRFGHTDTHTLREHALLHLAVELSKNQ